MPADLFIPPPGWEGVDATLGRLRASTSELGEFLDRQWDELESLRRDLVERIYELGHREREVARKERELASALELAKLRTELAEARCELSRRPHGEPDETEDVRLAAPIRIAEVRPEHHPLDDTTYRRPAKKLPTG